MINQVIPSAHVHLFHFLYPCRSNICYGGPAICNDILQYNVKLTENDCLYYWDLREKLLAGVL